MNTLGNQSWFGAAILFAILYLVVGIVFGELASLSASKEIVVLWRLAAWLVSAIAFTIHIGYEHVHRRTSPPSTALHASVATAIGAFALAVAANVRALWTATGNQRLLALALVLWPILTAVPAFVVAWVLAAVLARVRPTSKPDSM